MGYGMRSIEAYHETSTELDKSSGDGSIALRLRFIPPALLDAPDVKGLNRRKCSQYPVTRGNSQKETCSMLPIPGAISIRMERSIRADLQKLDFTISEASNIVKRDIKSPDYCKNCCP